MWQATVALMAVTMSGLWALPASAAFFDFAYVFGPDSPYPGTTVEGLLEGDLSATDPNLIENVVVTSVVVDGGAVATFEPTSTSPDHDTVSFDGSEMDLEVEGVFNGLFAVLLFDTDHVPPTSQAVLGTAFGTVFDAVFEPARWELAPSPPTVPAVPGTMLFVLGGLIVVTRSRWPRR